MKKIYFILMVLLLSVEVYSANMTDVGKDVYYVTIQAKIDKFESQSMLSLLVYNTAKNNFVKQNFRTDKQLKYFTNNKWYPANKAPTGKNLYFEANYPSEEDFLVGKNGTITSISTMKEMY